MSGITRKQARLLKEQIRKIYGREFIPNVTGDNSISIGDILLHSDDYVPVVDSKEFDPKIVKFVEGKKVNRNITSSSDVSISTKLKGEATLSEYFKLNEAGLAVHFSGEDQMFLKIQGGRQRSMSNFIEFRKHILSQYTKGDISSKIYIVRGLIYADKYSLQYSGKNGGNVGFKLDGEINSSEIDVKANFSLKWQNQVGYNVNADKGGVLGYRVSAVRLKRHTIPLDIHRKILDGMSEEDILNNLSFEQRKKLLENDSIELVDATDEVIHNKIS